MYSFLVFQTTFFIWINKKIIELLIFLNNHSWWHINNLSNIIEQLHIENAIISAIVKLVMRNVTITYKHI